MSTVNTVTEQLTRAGQAIEHDSFAIIDAEVQGHSAAERKFIGGKKNVRIKEVAPVGNYAIRLEFDDGHNTGIFSWKYLAELGRDHDEIWGRYVQALAEKGLTR